MWQILQSNIHLWHYPTQLEQSAHLLDHDHQVQLLAEKQRKIKINKISEIFIYYS